MKMNVSMSFMKPLSGTVKKYKALVPPVIILAVALLLYLPLMWLGGKVRAEMEKSSQNARTVQSLMSTPPADHVEQVRDYMDKFEEEAAQIQTLDVETSRRDLVTYDYVLFPQPRDESSQVYTEFGKKYRAKVEQLVRQMNALDAPSEAEIRSKTGAPRTPGTAVRGATEAALDPMVDALCQSRAQEVSVYANPDVFLWYGFWDNYKFSGKDQALEDCWDAQTAYWIYQDIVDTIVKMNGTTARVPAAPVKRLLGVSFMGPVVITGASDALYGGGGMDRMMMYDGRMPGARGGGAAGQGVRDIPNYVTALLPSNFVSSPTTGRVGNQEVDVIHFAVSVVVDNRFVMAFMKELCSEKPHVYYPDFNPAGGDAIQARHNQISILESNIQAVDKLASEHMYYRYGSGAAMRLDLICEYQFVREGYDSIKPEPVKKRLGQSEAATDSAAPGMPAMPSRPGDLGFPM